MRPRAAWLSLVALLALVIVLAPAASASTPNGWTTHTGPGYELYISPHQNVGSTELTLVVNYGSEDMTLRVSRDNMTVSSVVIAPHASRFVQLDYPSNGTYQVTLSSAGTALLTLSKQRIIPVTPSPTPPPTWDDDDWNIMPPGPNPWVPTPEPQDPLKYTQAAVDALLANITLEILLTTAAVMGVMVVAGALVQRKVKFVYPTDVITIALLMANLGLVWLTVTKGIPVSTSTMWYIVPELAGYFLGYMLGGRITDTMVEIISPSTMSACREPMAIYEHDGRQCIADQNNRALLKRVLFGIHHEIDTGGIPLRNNWDDLAKYRLFPRFDKRKIYIEKLEPSQERVRVWWKLSVSRYTSKITLAYGSRASIAELIEDEKVLFDQRNKIESLESEIVRLQDEIPRMLAAAIMKLMRPSYERTTLDRIEEYLKLERSEAKEEEPERPEPQEASS